MVNFCVLEIHADAQRVTTPMLGGCAWSALSCHFCYLAQIFRWPCHTFSASIKTKILRYLVRPILMQLDSQSVEKVPFSTFVRAFAPKIKGMWSFSPQNESELSPRSIQSCFPFSRGSVAGDHRPHFFDPTGSNTITIIPNRIEKKRFFDPIGGCNNIGPT